MDVPYRILELRRVAPDLITPHPAALLPMDDEDKGVLTESIKDRGVIQPLLVLLDANTGRYKAVDGCNRLEAAVAAGLSEIPVNVIECDSVADVVYHCLTSGRKRSTGQRVISYLRLHKADVLAALPENHEAMAGKNLRKGQQIPVQSRDRTEVGFWTSRVIAERLGCSDKDVLAGIDMLLAKETGEIGIDIHNASLKGVEITEAEIVAAFNQTEREILCGAAGIRRWRAAFAGRVTTKGKSTGKAPTDFYSLALRTLTSMGTVWANWKSLNGQQRATTRQQWLRHIDNAPADFLTDMAAAAVGRMGKSDLVDLTAAIQKRLKDMR
jgi:hypothetical protein